MAGPQDHNLELDTRNGTGISTSVELQTEAERQVGIDSNGTPKFIYFKEVPQIITKTTYSALGEANTWNALITKMIQAYDQITDVPTGIFIESVNVGGGWFIINGKDYYSGSYTEVDYNSLTISPVDDEFKVLINESAQVAPSGFLPDGRSYYSSNKIGKNYSRSSTCSLTTANKIRIGTKNSDVGGFITSKSMSNLRLINNVKYVDLSLDYISTTLKAEITIA